MAMDKLFKPLVDNWVVLAALIGLGVGWGTTIARVSAAENAQSTVEHRVQKVETDINSIKESVVRIETNQTRDAQEAARIAAEAARLRASVDALLLELRTR